MNSLCGGNHPEGTGASKVLPGVINLQDVSVDHVGRSGISALFHKVVACTFSYFLRTWSCVIPGILGVLVGSPVFVISQENVSFLNVCHVLFCKWVGVTGSTAHSHS